MSEDVLLILFAGRLLGGRGGEWSYEEDAAVLCLSVMNTLSRVS